MKISEFIEEYGNHENSHVYYVLTEDKELERGDVVMDIGANTGQEIEMLMHTPALIESFEPHPRYYTELVEKYKNTAGIKLYNQAAWDSYGEMTLHYKKTYEHHNGGASLVVEKNQGNSQDNVKVKTFDTGNWIASNHPRVEILKIDAEGAEFSIIQSLIEAGVLEDINCIVFEDHERKINSKEWQDRRKKVLATLESTKGTIKSAHGKD